jgi:general secretion pathway protein J
VAGYSTWLPLLPRLVRAPFPRFAPTEPRAPRHRGSSGYLLVETLATLAISAAVLAGLASALGLVLRTGDRAAARVEEMERSGRAVAAMARDIRHLARLRWSGAARRSFVFSGEPDRILFARWTRDADGFPAAEVVVLQSLATDAGGRLLKATAPLPTGAAILSDLRVGPAEEVYSGPSLIRLAYVARPENGGAEILVDAWPSATALPVAVRIGILDPATGRLASSVRVPVLVEAEPGCAAPKTAFCSRVDPSKPSGEGGSSAEEARGRPAGER